MYAMKTAKLRDEWDMVEIGRVPRDKLAKQVWVRAVRGREVQRPAALEQAQSVQKRREQEAGGEEEMSPDILEAEKDFDFHMRETGIQAEE